MMWMVCALGGIGWAVEPAPVSSADFRSYLDQARFFLRKEWYDDAREQLELAVSTEDGKLDAEAWFLLAKVRYELGDLQGARFAADRALVHSQDDEQARQTHELLTWLDQKFGYVTLDAPYDGVRAIVEVELQSTIFDP
ncbi:MAG: tetratricopeptide repeat protein, partial [Myxococcota bacterium]